MFLRKHDPKWALVTGKLLFSCFCLFLTQQNSGDMKKSIASVVDFAAVCPAVMRQILYVKNLQYIGALSFI